MWTELGDEQLCFQSNDKSGLNVDLKIPEIQWKILSCTLRLKLLN
jgi:hypothetical protein